MAQTGFKGFLLQYFVLLGCPSFYLVLLICDVCNSWQTHSYWVAPNFLSLNAFTLQIMSAMVDVFKAWRKPEDLVHLIAVQQIVDAARLMSCISIAYIVPDVAHYSFKKAREYLGTLGFIGLGQMIYRIYSLSQNQPFMDSYQTNTPPSGKGVGKLKYEISWLIISNGVYSGALFLLLLVLACTLTAGKTMKALAMNRITRKISYHSLAMNNTTRSQSVPPIPIDEVFYELWLVVRSSRPSNVAARSLLSSASTFICTLLVGFTIAKWAHLSNHDMFFQLDTIDKAVVVVECIFVMGGWFVLLWRWFATVYYFSYDNSPEYLRKYITQSEKEVNYSLYLSKFFGFQLPNHIKEKILIKVPAFVHHSLKPVFCIMKYFLLLCKIASIIHKILTKLFFCILNKIIKFKKQQQAKEYATYINCLRDFTMFGETPESLWASNFWAFKKVKIQVQKGNVEGKKLWGDIQGLGHGVDHPQLYFNEECCWKMEVIWHVTMLMYRHCDTNSNSKSNGDLKEAEEAIDRAIQYGGSELWDILTFMEQNESKNLIADNEFRRLQRLWQKCCSRGDMANKYLEDEVKRPLEEALKNLSPRNDCDDWKRQEIARYFNTRCKSSVLSTASIDSEKVLADTVDKGTKWVLANLYHTLRHCICEFMHKGVLESCYKWASKLDENNLCGAAFEIGKAQGLMEAANVV